jgi:hypothetical protein
VSIMHTHNKKDQSWSLRWNHLTTNSEAAATTLAPPATPIPMWYIAGPVRSRTFWEYSFNANAMGTAANVMGAVTSQMIDNESEKSLSPTTSDSKGPRAEKKMPLRTPFTISSVQYHGGKLETAHVDEAEEYQHSVTICEHPDTKTSDSGQQRDKRSHLHPSKLI